MERLRRKLSNMANPVEPAAEEGGTLDRGHIAGCRLCSGPVHIAQANGKFSAGNATESQDHDAQLPHDYENRFPEVSDVKMAEKSSGGTPVPEPSKAPAVPAEVQKPCEVQKPPEVQKPTDARVVDLDTEASLAPTLLEPRVASPGTAPVTPASRVNPPLDSPPTRVQEPEGDLDGSDLGDSASQPAAGAVVKDAQWWRRDVID